MSRFRGARRAAVPVAGALTVGLAVYFGAGGATGEFFVNGSLGLGGAVIGAMAASEARRALEANRRRKRAPDDPSRVKRGGE